MNHINILITLILILEPTRLFGQTSIDQDKKQVTEVVELFFNSMRNRDTLTLKTCIHFSHPANCFFKQFSANDQQLTGNSASTEGGFLKSVSDSNGFIGKCQNEFDNIDIKIDQRYAIVTAHYRCFVEGHSNNSGIYTVQMLKSDKWRIESLTRYTES
jgi:hypothetical protein